MHEFVQAAARRIADDFINNGADPTEALVKVAQMGKLSAHQIERVATKTNQKILLKIHGSDEPHGVFDTIKTASVLAILARKPLPGAVPSLPPSTGGGWLDVSPNPELTSRSGETIDQFTGDSPEPFPDRGVALMVLKHLKMKAGLARSKAARAELMVSAAIAKLLKEASPYLMRNEPITPLKALPENAFEHLKPMVEKYASLGYQNPELDQEFELVPTHPIYKIAMEIADCQQELANAKDEIERADERTKMAKYQMKKKKWM